MATIGGFAAIVLWSTSIAGGRSLGESLGLFGGAAAIFSVSGTIALARLVFSRNRRQSCLRLPAKYLYGCGLLFVLDMLSLYMAIGLADSNSQLLEIGLINYLWPVMTLLGSLVILGKKGRIYLVPGTLLALAGLFLVLNQKGEISWQLFAANIASNPPAYLAALGAAVFWAFYSNLARRWGGQTGSGGVDLFLPATAIVLVTLSLLANETRSISPKAIAEMIFLGVATYIAYGLWDNAMRSGNVVLVAAGSYLIPLLSTIVSSLYLSVVPRPILWVGCGMLIAGSVISWRSVSESPSCPSLQTSGNSCS